MFIIYSILNPIFRPNHNGKKTTFPQVMDWKTSLYSTEAAYKNHAVTIVILRFVNESSFISNGHIIHDVKRPSFCSLNNLAYDGYCVWSGRQVNDTVQEECFDWTPVTLWLLWTNIWAFLDLLCLNSYYKNGNIIDRLYWLWQWYVIIMW